MPIDPKVSEAIYAAVTANKQPKEVGKRLEAWMNELSNGNATLEKPDDYKRRLEILLDSIKVTAEG